MIISRTPLRISYAGGGSDLPAFYLREPGAVVSSAISKYIYITVNQKFDPKIRASYSETEIVGSVDELKHELIREAMKLVGVDGGIEITSISDIPSQGSGLGSSSSYTVGLLNALHAYAGHYASPELLAQQACEIEIQRCKKPIGKQDQYIAAYGNTQLIRFNPDDSVFVDPIVWDPRTKKLFFGHLLLMYTGITRNADEILREQSRNSQEQPVAQSSLRKLTQLAVQLNDAFHGGEIDSVGEVLHQGWLEKRKLASGITNPQIDEWYNCARAHGAIGGKLLGAGGGGFFLFYAPPDRHAEIVSALSPLRQIHFRLEPQGSKIIFIEDVQVWR